MKICFVSRFDSFVRLAQNYAIQFKNLNWEVSFVTLESNMLSDLELTQLKNNLKFNKIELEPYNKEVLLKSDVIFFCLTGGYIKKLLKSIDLLSKKERPYLISAYPGVVYQNIYDGFTSRSLCDLIIFPSFKEKALYDTYCDQYNLINAGIVGGYFKKRKYADSNFENDIIFAEQTVVPNTITDRLYLAQKLVELAEKNPNKKVFIKPRTSLSGKSLFETKLHIIDGLSVVVDRLPNNLIITYKPIEYYTSQGAMCVTISSTAAIETLQFHDKVAFVTDFGPSENNGGTYFRYSNVELSFSDLISGNLKTINEDWKKNVYISNDQCINKIIERINEDIKLKSFPGYWNSRLLYSNEYLNRKEFRVKRSIKPFRVFQNQINKIINFIKQ